jgi:hypothetical protein
MALEITREANDELLVKTLGIKSLTVHFDDMGFTPNRYSDQVVKPTSALVTLSEDVYDGIEPTDDWQYAVRVWVAGKLGIDANDVQIA